MIIGCLSYGRRGPQSVTISSSKRGYQIKFGRTVWAKAKTPEELVKRYNAWLRETTI